jgi:hypothetical protein
MRRQNGFRKPIMGARSQNGASGQLGREAAQPATHQGDHNPADALASNMVGLGSTNIDGASQPGYFGSFTRT